MIACLVNPASAGGRTASIASSTRNNLESRMGESVELYVTTRRQDARRFTSEALRSSRYRMIVVVGGDGTLQEVANGWMDTSLDHQNRCTIGLVSSGTGQGLAQGLGLPADHRAQLDIIASGRTRRLDLGHVRSVDPNGLDDRRWFVNECQLGIGGAVVHDVERRGKHRTGRWTFATAALQKALTVPNRSVRIEADHVPTSTVSVLGIVIGNGPYTGGGMNLTPGASPFDGKLDLLVMGAQSVPQRIGNLARIYSAGHIGRPEFSLRRCERVSIDAPEPVEVEADGEFIGSIPCRISVLPAALAFIVPPEAV